MAKPIKMKREEAESQLFECPCGEVQTSELMRCPECGRHLCDVCMPFGSGVSCIDCTDPDTSELDETDF